MKKELDEDYFELKKRKAEEQGKKWWFEAILTDEEANLRTQQSCLSCKKFNSNIKKCTEGHNVTCPNNQICDEWRYFA